MKLHLGCGERYIPGFLHVDLAEHAHIDYHQDVRRLDFASDCSADLIYASHVLEYFDREEAGVVLKEWLRVLVPGGTLRIAVPDFENLIRVYEMTGDLSKVLGPLYGRRVLKGGSDGAHIYHRTVYDFTSLKILLENAGFEDVSRYDWRNTVHRDFDDHSQAYFPHMDKENGILISLNVEAIKVPLK